MSMKLMVRVLEEAELTRPQQAILLAMAENANDDGSSCRPSVDLIAWKAGYKPRNVIDIMRDLRHMGVLEVVREATQRRATEYHIHVDKAPRKQTFQEWQAANGRHVKSVRRGAISRDTKLNQGCNSTSLGVQSRVKETRENAPEPVNNPVTPPTGALTIVTNDPKPAPQNGPAQKIMAAFCEALGIERLANYDKAGGQAKLLVKAGVTPEEMPQIVEWLSGQAWLKDGFDLGTVVNQIDKWQAYKRTRNGGSIGLPVWVTLLPGERVERVGDGAWDLIDGTGRVRQIRPEFCGVIRDERKHRTIEGQREFSRLVQEAQQHQQQRSVS
jgi:hypothetical protein